MLAIQDNNMALARALMPARPDISQPKIFEVAKSAGPAQVVLFIAMELARLSELVNVGGNLTASQIDFIARNLYDQFPNESLCDFKICFERGAMGRYGEIFRLDGITINKWFTEYLNEKYQDHEYDLKKEKQTESKPQEISTETDKMISDYLKELSDFSKVPAMSKDEISYWGKERFQRRAASAGYVQPDVDKVTRNQLHIQWIKENYDPITGRPLSTWKEESEWLSDQISSGKVSL